MKKVYWIWLSFVLPLCLLAQPLQTPPSFYDVNPQNMTAPFEIEPNRRHMYVLGSTGVLLVSAVASAGLLYLMPSSFTNWHKEDFNDFHLLGRRWGRNVSKSPVVDKDDFFLNWVTHPYWGAVYYMQPRVAGYDWTDSVLYSVIASSFFWEYGIEAFAEVPSWQDLIITPAIGSALGEVFYRLSVSIQSDHNQLLGSPFLGQFSLILMDPLRIVMQSSYASQWLGVKKQNDFVSYLMPEKNGVKLVILRTF